MSEVERFEEQFAHRFSDQDEEFQKYLRQASVKPPIVEGWRNRGRGFQEGRPHRGRDRGWDQRSYDRGYGGQHNAYNQRARYDRY